MPGEREDAPWRKPGRPSECRQDLQVRITRGNRQFENVRHAIVGETDLRGVRFRSQERCPGPSGNLPAQRRIRESRAPLLPAPGRFPLRRRLSRTFRTSGRWAAGFRRGGALLRTLPSGQHHADGPCRELRRRRRGRWLQDVLLPWRDDPAEALGLRSYHKPRERPPLALAGETAFSTDCRVCCMEACAF